MDFKIDKSLLKKKENFNSDIEGLLARISTGKAILFTGAGFSMHTKNVLGEEPPSAKDLAKKICNLGGFSEDDDLRFAADYYIENKNKNKLIDLLKDTYSLSSVSKIHNDICSVDWRRFYTTNYDKSIEIASANIDKRVECIDLEYRTDLYYKNENLCIHLNGSIDSLTEVSLEKGFKLSTSSYISPDSFLTSSWFYYFKRDLERSSAIVFVGYSMYDIEIQKVLFENVDLKEKTFFITRENPDSRSVFTLSKFGHVLPIGVEEFANQIDINKKLFEKRDSRPLESFVEYKISNVDEEIRDSNVETLLMYGDIKQSFIDNAVVGVQRIPYLILRNQLEKILNFSKSSKSTIVFSDFGNGKSLFLLELLPYLSVNSFNVYTVEDRDGDYISDIDALSKLEFKSIIILDGYERYMDLIEHFSKVLPSNISIIGSARTSEHERFRGKLKDINFAFNELNIDELMENESIKFVEIFDNIGLWGDKAGLSKEGKRKYLMHDNNMQISLVLLDLFNSPQIKERVSKITSYILNNNKYKDTIFAIALLETLNLPVEYSLISEIAFNDEIYSNDLNNNIYFSQLFKTSKNKIISKSGLFCLSLIRNYYNPSYVIPQLHKIAKKYSDIWHKSFIEDKIFKSALRFSFVERLFPETNKKANLKRYYEDLKVHVPWLRNDPHFWLQYGMANIPFKDYEKAQGYFDQAYALAKNKDNYHTKDIDTQQARLFILMAIASQDSSNAYDIFQRGHDLLSTLIDDVYKFRQVDKYRDFFESCFERISKNDKVRFEHACKNMISAIDKAEQFGEINLSEQVTILKTKDNLNKIIATIVNRRK